MDPRQRLETLRKRERLDELRAREAAETASGFVPIPGVTQQSPPSLLDEFSHGTAYGLAELAGGIGQLSGAQGLEDASKGFMDQGAPVGTAGTVGKIAGQVIPSLAIPASRLGLLGRAGYEGGVNAGLEGLRYADNASERGKNMMGGLLGGAAGTMGAGLIGKAFSGGAPKVVNETVELGKQFDVPVGLGDAMKIPNLQRAENFSEHIPVVGMMGYRAKQLSKAQDAIGAFGSRAAARADNLAPATMAPPQAVQDSLLSSLNARKDAGKRLYDEAAKLATTDPIATPALEHTANRLVAQMKQNISNEELQPKYMKLVSRYLEPGDVNFQGLQTLRTKLSDDIDNYAPAQGGVGKVGIGPLKELRDAMTADIERAALDQGGDLLPAWQRANDNWKAVRAITDDPVIKDIAKAGTDQIAGRLLNQNKVQTVRKLYDTLDEGGQARLQSFYADELLNKALTGLESDAVFSPAKFAGSVERLKKVIPGAFRGERLQEVEGLAKLMRDIDQAGSALSPGPQTGVRAFDIAGNLPWVAPVLQSMMGLGASSAVPGGIVAAGAAGLRAAQNPALRDMLIQYAATPVGSQSGKMLQDLIIKSASRASGSAGGEMAQ